jgi:sugar lactone lactonase YvrE
MRAYLIALAFTLGAVAGCNGGGSSTCGPGGNGSINITAHGLPAGASGTVTLTGASTQMVSGSQMVTVGSGNWKLTAGRAYAAGTIVRTVYTATVTPASFCLSAGGTQAVDVTWTPIPTSNKLWASNGAGGTGSLLGFAAADLTATGSRPAAASVQASAGRDLSFDADGNLWALGATTADATVVRFSAASLAHTGNAMPDRGITITGLSCVPGATGLALAANGDVWVSSACAASVYRLSAAQVANSGSVTPALTIGNLGAPQGVAFDGAGNLWIADPMAQALARYDAATLGAATPPAAAALVVQALATDTPGDMTLLNPGWIAFDSGGKLWSNDFGGNIVFPISVAQQTGTGSTLAAPAVRITVGVGAIIEGMAVDESGGLWMAYNAGSIAQLGAAQLGTSSGAGAPTTPAVIVSSADIGSVGNVGFYPAPVGTGLVAAVH